MKIEGAALLGLALLSSKQDGKKEENGMKEGYETNFNSQILTATTSFHAINWYFPDGKTRYLTAAHIYNNLRQIDVQLIIAKERAVSYTKDLYLKAMPTHPMRRTSSVHIFEWQGNQPILKRVRFNTQQNQAGDVLTSCICYEEKIQ